MSSDIINFSSSCESAISLSCSTSSRRLVPSLGVAVDEASEEDGNLEQVKRETVLNMTSRVSFRILHKWVKMWVPNIKQVIANIKRVVDKFQVGNILAPSWVAEHFKQVKINPLTRTEINPD